MGFCEALGKKAHSQVCVFGRNTGFRQTVGLVKKSNSKPVTHTHAADTFALSLSVFETALISTIHC